MRNITTISLKKETKEMIRRIGEKGETYDDIIRRIFKKRLDEHWNKILASDEFIPLDEL
jgi:hypothetical protein